MPDNVIGNINSISQGNQIAIKSINTPFVETFYFSDFYDEKVVKQFIKTVERLIRTSREYKTYIELLRTNVQVLNHDNIMKNITSGDVDLEFHHYPFTLYEIIEICMTKHAIEKTNFTSFSLAKEVMELHYQHKIGLVSLTKTMHELAHSGNLFLSKDQIFGNYEKFILEYKSGINVELMNKVKQMEEMSKNNIPSDFKGLLK